MSFVSSPHCGQGLFRSLSITVRMGGLWVVCCGFIYSLWWLILLLFSGRSCSFIASCWSMSAFLFLIWLSLDFQNFRVVARESCCIAAKARPFVDMKSIISFAAIASGGDTSYEKIMETILKY